MTITEFKSLSINGKLKWAKIIANLATLNSVNKDTLHYILKWTVDYFDIVTDKFKEAEE